MTRDGISAGLGGLLGGRNIFESNEGHGVALVDCLERSIELHDVQRE